MDIGHLNMDTITITDVEVFICVGVPDEERAKPQRLLITISMERDFAKAAAADDLRETIDYHAVSRRVLEFGQGRSWKLIETLACEIARMVVAEHGAACVEVEVKKFILPEAKYVSVRHVHR